MKHLLNQDDEERFIAYFNKNFIKINGLWRFLHGYNRHVLFLTKAVIGVGLLITLSITFNHSRMMLLQENPLRFWLVFIFLLLCFYLTYLYFMSPTDYTIVDDKFVRANPFYRVKKIIYYWTPILYWSIFLLFFTISMLLNWDVGGDEAGPIHFTALFMPPSSIIFLRYMLKEHYGARVFPEFDSTTIIDCEYRDFVDGKLPDVNNPMLEINQKLHVQVILHPRNEYEKGLIQFINQANGGLVWSLSNSGIADKLRKDNNTLTAEVWKIGEFGKLKIELTRNFLLYDELNAIVE